MFPAWSKAGRDGWRQGRAAVLPTQSAGGGGGGALTQRSNDAGGGGREGLSRWVGKKKKKRTSVRDGV